MNVGLLDHLLALALVVAVPAYGAWEYPKFVERARTRPGLRRREYQFTIAMEWGLVAVALVIWRAAGRGWAELGELLYRGFLLWYLAAFIGTWPAFAVGSICFGIAHLYQGAKGFLKTLVVGAIYGILYLGTGSLLWPMILHAALDLGAIGFALLLDEPANSGAS